MCRSLGAVIFVLFSHVGVSEVFCAADEAITVKQILGAWNNRRDSIRSAVFNAKIVDTRTPGGRPIDPFEVTPEPDSALGQSTVEKSLRFVVADGRFARTEDSERWDSSTRKKRRTALTAVFDGAENRYLTQGRAVPLGGVEIDDPAKPHDRLVNNDDLIAFWMAWSPAEVLVRMGYQPKRMRIARREVLERGHECAELMIPSSNQSWVAHVLVDAVRDHIPLQLALEFDGEVRREYSLDYVSDRAAGWRVSGWSYVQLNESGGVQFSSGRVTHCSLNPTIQSGAFTLEFPEGTHVVVRRDKSKKYFLVLPNGTLGPITASEFGSPATSTNK